MLHLNSGKPQCFSLAFHTMVTLRSFDYAPPDTGVSSLKLVSLERLLSIEGTTKILMDITFLRGEFLVCRHQTASPGGSWPGAAGTDEGWGALADCFAVLSKPSLLPGPHPPLRGTFPQRKAWGFPHIHGFPYEGKLSAVRLTDEVDSVT